MPNRAGIAIITVLVVIVVSSAFLAARVRSVVQVDRQARIDRAEVQVRWLAEAGLRRAAAQLARDDQYAGETWQIAAEQLGDAHGANVELQVTRNDDENVGPTITAVATYPAGNNPRVKRTKSVRFIPR